MVTESYNGLEPTPNSIKLSSEAYNARENE
jgi:hypothetical protein